MDLSKQVFCAGMAYVTLSRVRQMQNLHLIAFDGEAIKVSAKCLQEINRLRETYRPDLPQYSVPREKKGTAQNRKRKMSGSLDKHVPSLKKTKTSRNTKVADVKGAQPPVCAPSTQPQPQVADVKGAQPPVCVPSTQPQPQVEERGDVKGTQPPVCAPSTQPQPQVEERATTSVSLKEETAGSKRKLEPADAAQSEPPPKKNAESPVREIRSVRSRQR